MINYKAIIAIYFHEIERTKRTIFQSIISPILTTSLYFIIFGSAIGSRIKEIDTIAAPGKAKATGKPDPNAKAIVKISINKKKSSIKPLNLFHFFFTFKIIRKRYEIIAYKLNQHSNCKNT